MDFVVYFDAARNIWVSDPAGLEVKPDAQTMMFVFNDGRTMRFDAPQNGFQIMPGNILLSFVAERNRYETDGGSTVVWFDAARNVWVVNEGGTIRYRVFADITGNGTVSGAGFHEAGASVTVAATPADGWELSSFTRGGVEISNPYTFTMPSADVTVKAIFVEVYSFLLTEAGDFLLLESGDKIII
jgi:hypothetical protein